MGSNLAHDNMLNSMRAYPGSTLTVEKDIKL